jgi:hypothetical protein
MKGARERILRREAWDTDAPEEEHKDADESEVFRGADAGCGEHGSRRIGHAHASAGNAGRVWRTASVQQPEIRGYQCQGCIVQRLVGGSRGEGNGVDCGGWAGEQVHKPVLAEVYLKPTLE